MHSVESLKERVKRASDLLRRAEQPIRILRSIDWPADVRQRFLAQPDPHLPVIEYAPFDPTDTLVHTSQARAVLPDDSPIECWLRRVADVLDTSANMLRARGTAEFHSHARTLYGTPRVTLPDGSSTALALATRLNDILSTMHPHDLGAPPAACHLATELAERVRKAIARSLPGASPTIEIVDALSANVVAGPNRIRIRRQACFTDYDLEQLVEHEVLVHVATSLNGRRQTDLKILAASHAGTTRTQEGLAVFAEVISGAMDIDRLQRLVDRVVAIERAIDGADFVDGYKFFLERGVTKERAFDNAKRVYRGGVIDGGAPFTKDVAYLDGLLRVHNFLRAAVRSDRLDCFRMLFCGKLDLEDLPALCHAAELGLCAPPLYLPPWATDLRKLVAHLAYSNFLNEVKLAPIRAHYDHLLADSPMPRFSSAEAKPKPP